jgi:ubiquitin-conjugating enzyme E2 variant
MVVASPEPWEMDGKPLKSWQIASIAFGAAAGVAAVKVGIGLAAAASGGAVLAVAGAAFVGYAAADLASGIYHWAIDNYPTEKTPVVGAQAKEFQIHHADGDAMGKSNTWYVLSHAAAPLLVPMAAVAIAAPVAGGVAATAATAGALAFLGAGWCGQALHRWAHQEHPGAFPRMLQKVGLAIKRENHLEHHELQFPADNYCIINGMWNKTLLRTRFWRKAESLVYRITGREPHSWQNQVVRAEALGLPKPAAPGLIRPYGPEYYKAHGGK